MEHNEWTETVYHNEQRITSLNEEWMALSKHP